jgi:hypothetical protein
MPRHACGGDDDGLGIGALHAAMLAVSPKIAPVSGDDDGADADPHRQRHTVGQRQLRFERPHRVDDREPRLIARPIVLARRGQPK